jgi:hypothetical protein
LERYFLTSYLISGIWIVIFFNEIFAIPKIELIKYVIYFYLFYILVIKLPINFKLNDESKNTYAYDWAKQTLSELPPKSHLYSWWGFSTTLWYLQRVENYRTDIVVINDGSDNWELKALQSVNKDDIYFIEKVNMMNDEFELIQIGNSYKLIRRIRF